jgi:hypothetical protein
MLSLKELGTKELDMNELDKKEQGMGVLPWEK